MKTARRMITVWTVLFCTVLSATAQDVDQRLHEIINKYCRSIEMIGNTRSGLTMKQRDSVRTKVVPQLFIDFPVRLMKTTGGELGRIVRTKKMSAYLIALQRQSAPVLNQQRTYELLFEYHTDQDTGVFWELYKEHPDGSKEYHGTINVYQTYEYHQMQGGEIRYRRDEEDVKEIRAIKKVVKGEVQVGLGDVLRAERLSTQTNY